MITIVFISLLLYSFNIVVLTLFPPLQNVKSTHHHERQSLFA